LLPTPRSTRFSLCVAACVFSLSAQVQPEAQVTSAGIEAPATWLDALKALPIFHWFELQPALPAGPQPAPGFFSRFFSRPAQPAMLPCSVAPLPPITDPVAASFNESQTLDTHDLTSAMARALYRFERLISAIGGSIELKSAYRPPAYQLHLQQVWDKWMELRNNQVPACQELRAQVHEEFEGHHLLESQRPVSSSDHTRGLAFDATVKLPVRAHIRRRKVTLDSLARMAGLRRPDILHDPVHFKYVGGRTARG